MDSVFGALALILIVALEVLAPATVLGGIASSVASGHWQMPRVLIWIFVGLVGLPVLLLSSAYFVGLGIALITFWTSAFSAKWRRTWLILPFVLTAVTALIAGYAVDEVTSSNLLLAGLFVASGGCAWFAIAKLGDTFGRDRIWSSVLHVPVE